MKNILNKVILTKTGVVRNNKVILNQPEFVRNNKVILRYVSNIHLELRTNIYHPKLIPLWDFRTKVNDKYYLALLGDIGNPYNNNLTAF